MFASRKKGGGHDSSAGLEAEGYRGKSAISPPPRSSRHGTAELLFLGPAWHFKRGFDFFDGKKLPNVISKSKLLFWKGFKLLKEWPFTLKQTFKSQHCNYILSITIKKQCKKIPIKKNAYSLFLFTLKPFTNINWLEINWLEILDILIYMLILSK